MGTVVIFALLMIQWSQGTELTTDEAISTLALVYLLFFSMNTFMYFALTNIQNFLTILQRLSHVFELEEKQLENKETVSEVKISVTNAQVSWGFRKDQLEDKPVVSNLNFSLQSQ
jgi:ABC-type transport system involved in cytochrome bd biosynthesis fused ATPase/permease subunit